jgi:hypothetical protein
MQNSTGKKIKFIFDLLFREIRNMVCILEAVVLYENTL